MTVLCDVSPIVRSLSSPLTVQMQSSGLIVIVLVRQLGSSEGDDDGEVNQIFSLLNDNVFLQGTVAG